MGLGQLLIYVLVLGLVAYLVWYIIGLMPIPQPFKNVAIIIFCIILIIVLLNLVGLLGPGMRIGELVQLHPMLA